MRDLQSEVTLGASGTNCCTSSNERMGSTKVPLIPFKML